MKKSIQVNKVLSVVFLLLVTFMWVIVPGGSSGPPMDVDASTLQAHLSYSYPDNRVGSKATITMSGTGGTKPYRYKLTYKVDNGSWVTKQNFNTNAKVVLPFNAAGTYTLKAYISDKNNKQTSVQKQFKILPKYTPLSNNATINKTTFNYGDTTVVTGKASGGNTPYKYAFYQTLQDGKRTLIQSYSTNAKVSKKLSSGYYKIEALVKDSDGNVRTKTFDITVKQDTGKSLSNKSVSSAAQVDVNGTVRITGKAAGGVTPYQYAYDYSLDKGTTWTTVSGYSKSAVKDITLNRTGTYLIRTKVKDQNGKVVNKNLTIVSRKNTGKVLSNPSVLLDIGGSDLVDVGAKTTITTKCSGGYLPYQYMFSYRLNSGSWKTLQAYSDKTSAALKFSSDGVYTIRVSVKDANGKVTTTAKTVTAIKKQSYSGLSKGTVPVDYGFACELTAEAAENATYAFYYKKASGNVWSKLQDYQTNRTVSFRPRFNEEYTVLVYTKTGTDCRISTYAVTPCIPERLYHLISLVNEERKKANVSELQIDDDLIYASGVRSEELQLYNDHYRPDGRPWQTVLDEFSVDYTEYSAENNSRAYFLPELVVKYWMKSPEHKKNLLDPNMTKCGANFCLKYWNIILTN